MKTFEEICEELCSVQPMPENCLKDLYESLKARDEETKAKKQPETKKQSE